MNTNDQNNLPAYNLHQAIKVTVGRHNFRNSALLLDGRNPVILLNFLAI